MKRHEQKKAFRCLKNSLIKNAGDKKCKECMDWEIGLGHLYPTGLSVIPFHGLRPKDKYSDKDPNFHSK